MASNPFPFVGGGEANVEMAQAEGNAMHAMQGQLAEMLSELQQQMAALRTEASNAVSDLETRMGQHLESRLKQAAAKEPQFSLKPPKPARFSGGNQGPKIHEWLHQAETYLLAAGLGKEPRGVHHIASFFEGDAAVWWRHHCQQQEQGTVPQPRFWKELRELMTEQFQVFNYETEVRDQYVNLRQIGTVSQYVAKFRALVLELPRETEEQKIYFFLRGLKPEIQARTRTLKPKTLARAMDIADEADRANKHAYGRRRFQSEQAPIGVPSTDYLEGPNAADEGVAEEVSGPLPMDVNALRAQQRGETRLRADN